MPSHHAVCPDVEDVPATPPPRIPHCTHAQEPPAGTPFDPQPDGFHPPALRIMVGGWSDNFYGPSPIPFNEKHSTPKDMSRGGIEDFKHAWMASVGRALKAGFDVIEVYGAHGILLHSFMSPASNKREAEYGGSFENRIRRMLEVVDLTGENAPQEIPVFNMESWTSEQSVKLAAILAGHGVDLIDASTGGSHPAQQITVEPGFQADFAMGAIPDPSSASAVGDKLTIGTVGKIVSAKLANELLEDGLGSPPAEELGVMVKVANQIHWGFGGRGVGVSDLRPGSER
ncbi:MAG: hypothetical protein M1832_000169 [Thelocarpon impressellum]|nr:MAG: hypothetical protein M1832_000169 [Thelocarpon impressellum]